jgi:hypothetical protein
MVVNEFSRCSVKRVSHRTTPVGFGATRSSRKGVAAGGHLRPGYTLAEMVVVFSVVSVVLTSAAVMIHTLAAMSQRMRVEIPHSAALTRLSVRLREDAHRAREWTVRPTGDGSGEVRLTLADGSLVRYETQSASITRRWMRDDQLVQQELYSLPAASGVQFAVEGTPERLLTLRVQRSQPLNPHDPSAVRVQEVHAALDLGRELR